MTLPKWLVVVLMTASVAAILGMAGAWWIAWPKHNTRHFIFLIREHRYADADRLFVPTFDMTARTLGEYYDKDYPAWDDSHLELEVRTIADMILGRQQFKVCAGPDLYFTAVRGSVRLRPNPWYVKVGWAKENLR